MEDECSSALSTAKESHYCAIGATKMSTIYSIVSTNESAKTNVQESERDKTKAVHSASLRFICEEKYHMIHLSGDRAHINVSGCIFETFHKTLHSKPTIFSTGVAFKYYNFDKNTFYFERNSKSFESILVYLQTGILTVPTSIPVKIFIEDLQFFGLEEHAERLYSTHVFWIDEPPAYQSCQEVGLRRYLWNILEYPTSSKLAKVVSVFSTVIICISIVIFCSETLPWSREKSVSGDRVRRVLSVCETGCVAWFTVEILLRVISSKSVLSFLKSIMNIIDLIAVIPFYVALLFTEDLASFALLRILRLVRVFRIFKLSRYSKAIQIVALTLQASSRELVLLTSFIVMVLILFASAIFYVEVDIDDPENGFKSIPHTFWMGIVTITTVGYGDLVPKTLGKKT